MAQNLPTIAIQTPLKFNPPRSGSLEQMREPERRIRRNWCPGIGSATHAIPRTCPKPQIRGTILNDARGLAMEPRENRIPDFRQDGYLPEGMFLASEAEVTFRFGTLNRQRRRLVIRVRRWIELAR